MSSFVCPRTESTHYRLYEFAKTALIKIFVSPYAKVCDLYCGGGVDTDKWDEAQIGHYIGIDASSSGISEAREIWDSLRKPYTADFCELDPCVENLESYLQDKSIPVDLVCCLQHLQLCFETEERARSLLNNVSSLLKPGGYFFGITPDSSTIWNLPLLEENMGNLCSGKPQRAKYQKNVEVCHNKGGSMKSGIIPNCIRSENYMITFEVDEEKFPFFGKKFQLKFANDIAAETHCLVHFPSLIRLAREAGLEYVEIQNLTEFYDDNRAQFAGMLMTSGPNFVDPRGRLLPRSFDVLGLYTTFIFQKPDRDLTPPILTPLHDGSHNYEERDWQGGSWRHQVPIIDEEKNGHPEPPPPPPPPLGLGLITEQKGILGPGPADLRFSEAL